MPFPPTDSHRATRLLQGTACLLGTLLATACGGSYSSSAPSPDASGMTLRAPSPDPRVGLKAGLQDAGEAIWNLQMVSHTPPPAGFAGVTNSDLAFSGHYVIQGNYNGFQIWDVADPAHPRLVEGTICPASQSDVSVYKNLLFVSAEAPSARLDCGTQAPREPVSKDRIRGLRIFDITDVEHPKYIANVQTCRGSHTHTVVSDPNDKENVYVYISGSAGIRPSAELAGCNADANSPSSSYFKIEVIKVPLAHPEQAAIVSSPEIFAVNGKAMGLINTAQHGASPVDTGSGRGRRTFVLTAAMLVPLTSTSSAADSAKYRKVDALMPLTFLTPSSTKADSAVFKQKMDALKELGFNFNFGGGRGGPPRGALTQCHDITAYPAVGLAGGACEGMGLLLDIRNPANPVRTDAVSDSNFSYWHSATFSNDGSMVLFSDEWGGGGAAYCRKGDPMDWGADAIFKIENGKMKFQSYYKMPAPQTEFENCVAHNGSLIPIPGRTVMVQAWYQGGLSVFEWTDPAHPREIAFFDRGPNAADRMVGGGYWSVYWYNGHIYGSEMERGLDVFSLSPSPAISQNEIDAAKTVQFAFLNVQDQPKFVWPATFALARAYADQLERSRGLSAAQLSEVRSGLGAAEGLAGSARRDALSKLAGRVSGFGGGSSDKAKVKLLTDAIQGLAAK